MQTPAMSRAQATLDFALWQAETETMNNGDLYIWLTEKGLAPEIAIRLKELISFTAKVGGKVLNVGKIILVKIFEFIEKHKNLAIGIALAAAVSMLIGSIPFLGPLLAPIALILGLPIGIIAGIKLDKATGNNGVITLSQDVIELARDFFQLFIDTIRAVADELAI